MIEDTFEGKTFSCTHENINESGICDKCLGKDTNTLREEWIKDFGNPPLMLEELTKGMSRCALCGIKAEQIADWWLNKFNQKLKEIEQEIEKCSDFADSGDTLKQRILQIIKNKKI